MPDTSIRTRKLAGNTCLFEESLYSRNGSETLEFMHISQIFEFGDGSTGGNYIAQVEIEIARGRHEDLAKLGEEERGRNRKTDYIKIHQD